MPAKHASAIAHPNIAFIKYWGNQDPVARIPSNGSISMTLSDLITETSVRFDPDIEQDSVKINGKYLSGPELLPLQTYLDYLRQVAGISDRAEVSSQSSFPISAGLASSASGYAALALAAASALGMNLEQAQLSRIARRGSGSASRSIFGGFVEWIAGTQDADSFSQAIAGRKHWPLMDMIAIVSREKKKVRSVEGHELAKSSPLQQARISDAPRRLDACRQAILAKDFQALASISEQDSNMMHAVMMTSSPPLIYWSPATIRLMHEIILWRLEGLEAFYTIDAGPNVHCICTERDGMEVERRLRQVEGVEQVIRCGVGEGAYLKQA